MRKIVAAACLTAAALGITGVAAAHFKSSGIQPATATFTTATDNARTSTCLGHDGTYRITTGRFLGRIDFAAPNDDLDGELSLTVRAVYNTTTKIGWVDGSFRTRDAGRRPNGSIHGVLGESNGQVTMSGFATGSINRRDARLVGALSATLRANDAGLVTGIDGALGQGTPSFPAVIAGVACTREQPHNGNDIPVRLTVKGTLQALTTDAITVNPLGANTQTCAITQGVSPSTAGYVVGQKVQMDCGVLNGTMTLLKLRKTK
jgi:hypothetical protein